MTPLRRASLLPLALVTLAACGMKASPAMAPGTASQAGYGQPTVAPQPGQPRPAAAPYAAPPPAATQTAPSSLGGMPTTGVQGDRPAESPKDEAPRDLPSALRLLDDEARALSGALPVCASACRSLGSMERAARVVCELTRDGEPARCDQARQRLREARERVRKGCGACEGGPRTDPDAPAP